MSGLKVQKRLVELSHLNTNRSVDQPTTRAGKEDKSIKAVVQQQKFNIKTALRLAAIDRQRVNLIHMLAII